MGQVPGPICRVRGLGKTYRFYRDARDRMLEWLSFGLRRGHQELTALEDVSFEIERGTCTGLIGHNGAGKSTLLRILGRLTDATSGRFDVQGRVFALTDPAVGFHPEFSGRDNASFAADLLRLRRRDRRRLVDEILEFSELGDAAERPLKTYSTGMMMRLGFSVAMRVEPDLLLVDEVLAVGDAHFTVKCVDAMDRFREAGGTVVFCSHDMQEIRRVCDRSLWIDHGRLRMEGPTFPVTEAYLQHVRHIETQWSREHLEEVGRQLDWPRLERIWLSDREGREVDEIATGQDADIHIEYEVPDPSIPFNIGIRVDRFDSMFCIGSSAKHEGYEVPVVADATGRHRGAAIFRLRELRLLPGEFTVSVYLADDRSMLAYHQEIDGIRFHVRHEGSETGLFRADTEWILEDASCAARRRA